MSGAPKLVVCLSLLVCLHGLRMPIEDSAKAAHDQKSGRHQNSRADLLIPMRLKGPLLAHPHGRPSFLLCVPFKNGYSWWSTVLCNATGYDRSECENHTQRESLLDRLFHHQDKHIAQIEQSDLLKVKFVRSPVTRALAAWLTWVGKDDKLNPVEDKFGDFVNGNMVNKHNPHWVRQSHMCNGHTAPEYRILKVEQRESWRKEYGHRFHMESEIQAAGGIKINHNNACPGYYCSAAGVIAKYYNPEIFDKVVRHYAEDIKIYGYTEDTKQWRDIVANSSASSHGTTLLHDTIDASEVLSDLLTLDLDALGSDDCGTF